MITDLAQPLLGKAQWAENEHRAGLTTAERVGVIAQLAAFGVSPTQIAKRTRAKRGEVTAALAVACSELAQAATVRYDFLDLAQAATVAEFEDDPEAVKTLVVAAKSGQFDHTAQRLRDARAETAERRRVAAELRAAGVTVIDLPGHGDPATDLQRLTDADGAQLTEDAHWGCPGHAAYVTTLSGYVSPGADLPATDTADPLEDPDDVDDPEDADPDEDQQTGKRSRPMWRSWIGARYVCTDPARYGHRDRWSGSDSGTDRKKVAEMDEDEREAARAQRRDVIESNKPGPAPKPSAGRGCADCSPARPPPRAPVRSSPPHSPTTEPWSPASAVTSWPPNSSAAPRPVAMAAQSRWPTWWSRSARPGRSCWRWPRCSPDTRSAPTAPIGAPLSPTPCATCGSSSPAATPWPRSSNAPAASHSRTHRSARR
jgi:hypothetical protein